jgi:hypothetical protein
VGTGGGAEANGGGGVSVDNKANGGGVVRGIDAGAIKRMVLVMLWVLVLAIQRMVVLGLVKLPLYRRQTLPSRQEWFALLGTHVNAPMISLNSRLYSLPE